MFRLILIYFLLINNVRTLEDSLLCLNDQVVVNKKNLSNVEYQPWTTSCVKRLKNGQDNFVVVSAEEALLASSFATENAMVLGYISPRATDPPAYINTVVLTRGTQKLDNVKGLKYCHPGPTANIPPSMSHEFLKKALSRNSRGFCNDTSITMVENFYRHLNTTLGPSCIDERWTADDDFDHSLKTRYSKLLELCETYDNSTDPFEQSLRCLIEGKGDVALTSLEKLTEMKRNLSLVDTQYNFLCKNGTSQSLNDACVWSSKPWPLLLGNRHHLDRLPLVREKLEELSLNLNSLPNNTTLSEYLKDFSDVPNIDNKLTCDRELTWCTVTTEEMEHCDLLRTSFLIYGIQPPIRECKKLDTKYADKYECIREISRRSKRGVMFIEGDQVYTATKEELEFAAFAKNEPKDSIRSVLVVNTSVIAKTDDLRDKSGCFSEFASVEWLSFVSTFNETILKTSCFYDEELSKFVGDSCMPGVRDELRRANLNIEVERVCKICLPSHVSPTAVNCNANFTENLFATSRGALDCLTRGDGDYAVFHLRDDQFSKLNVSQQFKVMCKNGVLVDLDKNLDEDCYLSVTATGAIVTKDDVTAADVRLAFAELNKLHSTPKLFPVNPYSIPNNALFGENVKGFYDVELCEKTATQGGDCKYIEKLSFLANTADTCSKQLLIVQEKSNSLAIIIPTVLIVAFLAIGAIFVYKRKEIRSWFGNNRSSGQNNEPSENRRSGEDQAKALMSGSNEQNDPNNHNDETRI